MRIITGRAGSGKTELILSELRTRCERGEGKQLLLVPELHSHSYERRLAAATGNHGARTAEVLTFSRLCDRVFAETGGLAEQSLTAAGQLLTLLRAAKTVQSGLTVYSGLVAKPQLLQDALRLIDECKTCRALPEQLFEAAEQTDDRALAQKLTDVAQLYTAYDRLCSESLPDPRDRLTLLRERLPESRLLQGMEVYLDGFLGFTPQESAVLDAIMGMGVPVCIAVTCDEAQPDLFYSGCRTVKKLERMAARHNQATEKIALGASRVLRTPDLAVIETQALLPLPETSEAAGGAALYAASTPFDECEHVAAEIRRMVREKGCRWRDFAVTARQMDKLTAPLLMAMARYEVPVFLAEKTDLLSRPPMALVTGALEAVQSYFRYEDLFTCLKTGLTQLSWEEIDQLENYVLTWNIRGGAWLKEWDAHPDGYGLPIDDRAREQLGQLNAVRKKAIEPFAVLRERLQGEVAADDCVRALYDFLVAVDAPARIAARADAYEAASDRQNADEYRQLWEILVSAMEQFAWACGSVALSAQAFSQMFRLVLSAYDVGSIPVSLDRVSCGPIDRVCAENVKYLFLLDANEGSIPLNAGEPPLLSENDRRTLEGLGIELKASGAERLLMEQETLYRALSCATEQLTVSYHTTDAGGASAAPSYLVGVLRKLLPGMPFTDAATLGGADRLQCDRTAADLACAYLSGDRSEAVRAAYAHYAADERVQRAAQQRHARGPLTAVGTVEGLYGKALRLTASRVDAFYSCRFAFFMRYGLKAKPRRLAQFAAPETGTFIHYVMEHALQTLGEQEGGAAKAQEEAVHRACRTAVQQYITEELGGLDNKTPRFRYLFSRLVKSVEKILRNVVDELQQSLFEPIDFELDFSKAGDLPPVECTEGDTTVSLSGKVDRVDGYIKDGKLYLRVMDYKSGKKAFSLSDVWYGLNMQLIIYLYALQQEGLERYRVRLAEQLNEIVPAGVLYVPARDEVQEAERDTDELTLQRLREKALVRSGLLSDDASLLEAMEQGLQGDGRFLPVSLKKTKEGEPELSVKSAVVNLEKFGKLARYTHQKLLEMGQQLRAGDVSADPCSKEKNKSFCDWCEFRAACRFDPTAGDKNRPLRQLSDEDFWTMVGGDANGNVDA